MAPKRKKAASKVSPASTTAASQRGASTSTSAARTRLPIASTPDDEVDANASGSARAKEAALLFWVNSALRRFGTPANAETRTTTQEEAPPTSAAVPDKTAATDPVTCTKEGEEEGQSQRANASAADRTATPAAEMTNEGGRVVSSDEAATRQQQQERQPQPVVSSSAVTAASSSVQMRDVLPVFEALVEGQLGDVALDVWLIGQVSLTRHPDSFARVLDDHEQAASGPQRALLQSVVPYFLVRGESFYTMDATVYPTLPLLAMLLRSPKVRKVVLHPALLYKLLFMYLGTDKVDVANVVDLGTWLTTARQGSSVLAVNSTLDVLPYETSSHSLSVDALHNALPEDVQRLLKVAISNVQSALFARARTTRTTEENEETAVGGEQSSHQSEEEDATSSADTDTDDDAHDGENTDEEKSDATHGAPNDSGSGDDGEDDASAVRILQELEPCDPDSHVHGDAQMRRRKRRQRRELLEGAAVLLSDMEAADATRALDAFAAMSSVYRFFELVLAPEVPTAASTSPSQGTATGTWLADACVRRTYGVFLCALMSYHGVFVSRERFEVMISDLDRQIGDLARRAAAVLETTTSPHNAHPADESTAESQPSGLLVALSAQEIVEYVQAELIDAEARRAVDAVVSGVRGPMSADGSPPRLTVAHVESCLEILEALRHKTTTNTTVSSPVASSAPSLSSSTASTATHIRLQCCCELVQLWLAVQERRAFKKLLVAQWGTANAKLHVHVLPFSSASRDQVERATSTPTTAATAEKAPDTDSSAPSSSSPWTHASPEATIDEVAAADPVVPVSTLSYSVHPVWEMHLSTTGRIFASRPNVQTIAKQSPAALYSVPPCVPPQPQQTTSPQPKPSEEETRATRGEAAASSVDTQPCGHTSYPMLREHPTWTLRHLYTAPPGCALVSLDFNQVELRVLAHQSQDPTLIAQLSHHTDVLTQMAQTVLRLPTPQAVRPQQRQAVKVIVYGLLYGMGPDLMNIRLAQLAQPPSGHSTLSSSSSTTNPTRATAATVTEAEEEEVMPPLNAKDLLDDFYASYPLVRQYLLQVRTTAMHERTVLTLGGVKHLCGPAHQDPNKRRQAAVAWAIQGGAADLLHEAMHRVHQQRHSMMAFLPAAPIALVAAAHDELIYAVPEAAVAFLLPAMRAIMERDVAEALHLRVPLRVTARVGPSLGELEKVDV